LVFIAGEIFGFDGDSFGLAGDIFGRDREIFGLDGLFTAELTAGENSSRATLAFLVVLRVLIRLFFSIDIVSTRSCFRICCPAR
jgi:hypothetical protein